LLPRIHPPFRYLPKRFDLGVAPGWISALITGRQKPAARFDV